MITPQSPPHTPVGHGGDSEQGCNAAFSKVVINELYTQSKDILLTGEERD